MRICLYTFVMASIFFWGQQDQDCWSKNSPLFSPAFNENQIWGKKRKVHRAISIFKICCKSYFLSVKTIFFRSLFLNYLVLCTPLGNVSWMVGLGVFLCLSLGTFLPILKYCLCPEYVDKFILRYQRILQLVCGSIVVISLIMICEEVCGTSFLSSPNSFIWLFLTGSIISQREISFVETLSTPAFKIEESEHYYRVTLGEWHWEFSKENEFDQKVFSTLLLIARNEKGEPAATGRPLAKVFKIPRSVLNRQTQAYQNEGNTFIAFFEKDSNVFQGKLQKEILKILREDFSLTAVEIQDSLSDIGYKVSIKQIQRALKKTDFNEIHEAIRMYCMGKKSENAQSIFEGNLEEKLRVKIQRNDKGYRVVLGNLHWDIKEENNFDFIGLLFMLKMARTHLGQKITGLRELARILEIKHFQKLDKYFEKYKYIGDEFRDLTEVFDKIETEKEDDKIRQFILSLWKEDIALPVTEVEKRVAENENLPNVGYNKIRRLMKNVNFWDIRKQIIRDLKKGKYRKSTQWVIQKYQEIINHLMLKLTDNGLLKEAEIDECIRLSQKREPLDKPQRAKPEHPPTLAWLKCFLFNLPKKIDGKICCPKCGCCKTSRKSFIPITQTTINSTTGKAQKVETFRFYCRNEHCSTDSFTATLDGSYILEESRYARCCLMLRMVMVLRGPYRAVADILGTSKSIVFNELSYLADMVEHWEEILGPVRFSGTICIDEKFVRIATFKKTKKRPFGYLFFAVDPATHDLLHIEIFASRDKQAAETFLIQLKAKGIYPKTIMTDLAETYDQPVRNVYGRSVTMARCFFHFKKNIFDHMNKQFGKKDIPKIAEKLKEEIFDVVDAKARKTIKKRYDALQKQKEQYLQQEPKLLPMFDCLSSYYPHLMRVVENERVSIRTNNPAELVIRHFNQRYKIMSGFKNLKTAQRHARLFQIVYRFSPLSNDIEDKDRRGFAPLELAGYNIRHMPIFQYLTAPLLFNIDPAKNLALLQDKIA